MTVTNSESGTNVHEIADGIFRISTPAKTVPGGFTFNQILVVDDEPLLFHTGHRGMFPLVRQAVAHVLGDVTKLRYVGFSHFESDESGALNEFLAVAPRSVPVCSTIGAMVSVNEAADRPARALSEGEELALGTKRLRWLDAPHLPHNWECGYLFETTTKTLLCGDLFTQPGADHPPLTEGDILGPSEALRKAIGGVALEVGTRRLLEKLASLEPRTLATMHGSAFHGNGSALLLAFADALGV
jgi:flavorubredoxin